MKERDKKKSRKFVSLKPKWLPVFISKVKIKKNFNGPIIECFLVMKYLRVF